MDLKQTFALSALARKLACAANGFRFLARFLFRRLLEISTRLHLPEKAFPLHLLFECAEGLLNIVVADGNLNNGELSICAGTN